MTLKLLHPCLCPISLHSQFKFPTNSKLTSFANSASSSQRNYKTSASSLSQRDNNNNNSSNTTSNLFTDNDHLIRRVSLTKDANEALQVIAEVSGSNAGGGGVVSVSDCGLIISAAIDRNNVALALSVSDAMRSSFNSVTGVDSWKWSRPDVNTYTLLIRSLAASLRVSDALKVISNVCRVGVSPGEEVPFDCFLLEMPIPIPACFRHYN